MIERQNERQKVKLMARHNVKKERNDNKEKQKGNAEKKSGYGTQK